MIKKNYKALIDGIIWGTIVFFLGKYSVSGFVSFDSLFGETMIVFTCIIVSAISAIYNLKYERIHEMLTGYVISFLVGMCWLCIIFSLNSWMGPALGLEIFPQRKLSDADGLIIILFQGAYLMGTFFFRISMLFTKLIKN